MAFDRKTSMYPNYGASGSSEELDAYGVWVKSEPQDMASGFADVSGFPDASNFTDISGFTDASDFSTGFDDIGIPHADFSSLESDDFGVGGFGLDNFDDGMTQDIGDPVFEKFNDSDSGGGIEQAAQEDMPTHLLMKIADELSSIRTELTTLKKEFTGIRAEGVHSGAGTGSEKSRSGFFAEDDEERVSLTGDEMENMLSSANLSSEESLPFDPLREEDEAALKRLSEQNEAANNLSEQDEPPAVEEIEFDFDDLGINLDSSDDTGEQPMEASGTLDDDDELQDLRKEGVTSSEDDPFSLLDAESAPQPSPEGDEPEVRGSPLNDSSLNEDNTGISLDETDLSFNFNDFSMDDKSSTDDLSSADAQTTDELSLVDDTSSFEDALSIDDTSSMDETISLEGASSDETLTLDETLSLDDTLTLDDTSSDDTITLDNTASLDDALSLDDTASLDDELSLDDTITLDNTASLDDALSLDDTLSLDDMSSLDDALSLENTSSNNTISLDDTSSLEDALSLDDTLSMDNASSPDDSSSLDDVLSLDDTLSMDDSLSLDDMLSLEPLPASETDNISLSAGKEAGDKEEEPVLDDINLDDDDTTLDMDDFKMDSGASQEDSLPKVIPEGFETGSGEETNLPLDDDLEVFADEDLSLDDLESEKEDSLAVKADKINDKDNGIPSGMKEEIKKVLSYMDHLLESLPEEKIEEFAKSEHFDTYKKLFKDLGLV